MPEVIGEDSDADLMGADGTLRCVYEVRERLDTSSHRALRFPGLATKAADHPLRVLLLVRL